VPLVLFYGTATLVEFDSVFTPWTVIVLFSGLVAKVALAAGFEAKVALAAGFKAKVALGTANEEFEVLFKGFGV